MRVFSIAVLVSCFMSCFIVCMAWDNVVRDQPNGVNFNNFPYPFPVPNETYPSDWPTFGRCTGCLVNEDPKSCTERCRSSANMSDPTCCSFANMPYINQWPNNKPSYPKFPGYGFFSWSGWAKSHKEGAFGGNLWILKWGMLAKGYSYTPNVALTVSVRDTIKVYIEEGYSLHKFLHGSDHYTACDFADPDHVQELTSTQLDMIPLRHAGYINQNLSLPCRENWKCYGTDLAVRSSDNNNDIQALNPGGIYGNSTCVSDPQIKCPKKYFSLSITFSEADIGKTIYFADKMKCTAGMKVKVEVMDNVIHWLGPVSEHPERYPKDGYLQNSMSDGVTLGPKDEAWIVLSTSRQTLYRVFDYDGWWGSCSALGSQDPPPSIAVQADVPSERYVYYPSGSNPRHLWKVTAKHFLREGEELMLGLYNPFSSCSGYNNVTLLPCKSNTGACNGGPTGFGQRFIVRRAVTNIPATTSKPDAIADASAGPSTTPIGVKSPVLPDKSSASFFSYNIATLSSVLLLAASMSK